MPKFIIEQDSSRKNFNNEPMPLGQYVPGAISLKNTNRVYTLFVGEINNGSLVDDLDVFKGNFKYYQQLLTLLPRLRNDVIIDNPFLREIKQKISINKFSGVNKTTGIPKPFTFINVDPINIPHPNKNLTKLVRKEIIQTTPPILSPNINLGNILRPVKANTIPLQNKVSELINTPVTKIKSSDIVIKPKVLPSQIINNNLSTIETQKLQKTPIVSGNNLDNKEKPPIMANLPMLRKR